MLAVAPAATLLAASDRHFPVAEVFAPVLPGLVPGRVIACRGPAATTLALALVAGATASGSWLAIVGVPTIGLAAAAELGVTLERVVRVDADPSRPAEWAERVAAAVDGVDLVITRLPSAERFVRAVRQRVHQRGAVLVTVGDTDPRADRHDLVLDADAQWEGLGLGHGHLRRRHLVARVSGRRAPRQPPVELCLP
jgi:threonine dehydrogenase-like Zn-dependent dehydrogenase